jgi:hypothetical protein
VIKRVDVATYPTRNSDLGTGRPDSAGYPVGNPAGGRADETRRPIGSYHRAASPEADTDAFGLPADADHRGQVSARPEPPDDPEGLLTAAAVVAGFGVERVGGSLRLSHDCGAAVQVCPPSLARLRWRLRTHRCGPPGSAWDSGELQPAPAVLLRGRPRVSGPAHMARRRSGRRWGVGRWVRGVGRGR